MKQVKADGIPVYCAHHELRDPAMLVENPRNPNRHPESQLDLLARIIKGQGWRAPITVSSRSGYIVRGHGRLQAALKLGVNQVPVDLQDYATEAEEWADLIADNRIAELAETDYIAMKDLLEELDTGEFDMDLTGYDEAELEDMMTWVGDLDGEGAADEDAEPTRGELLALAEVTSGEPRHQVHKGDHYLLSGKHHLFVASLFTDWQVYVTALTPGALFLPYPEPHITTNEKAEEAHFVLVQPNLYLAGHLLDRHEEAFGEAAIEQL